MSVARAQTEISSSEFTEWAAYSYLEPWDERRADLRAGIIAAQIHNIFAKKAAKPSDFMPNYDSPPKKKAAPITGREMAIMLKASGFAVQFK